VLEQAAGRRVAGAQLRERIALQSRDGPGDQERQPYRRARYLAGRAQEREDPRADHRPDPDEGGLTHRQVPLRGGGDGSVGLVHQRHVLLPPLTWSLAGITGRAGRAPAGSCGGDASTTSCALLLRTFRFCWIARGVVTLPRVIPRPQSSCRSSARSMASARDVTPSFW